MDSRTCKVAQLYYYYYFASDEFSKQLGTDVKRRKHLVINRLGVAIKHFLDRASFDCDVDDLENYAFQQKFESSLIIIRNIKK